MSSPFLSRAYITEHPVITYAFVWLLSIGIVLLELVGSGVSNSQALLADVGHVASDTLLALVPLAALLFVRSGLNYRTVSIVTGIAAAGLLLAIGWHVGSEAWEAIAGGTHHEHEVHGWALFIFSGAAAILNLFQHRFLSRIDPEHHHAAHKGLHFHVLMDLVKNVALPVLGLLIAFGVLADHVDLWAALAIGALLIVRAVLLLKETFMPSANHHAGHSHHA